MSLVIAGGNQQFTVTGDEALIGRDSACAIALPADARLAARHAALRKVGGRWLIEARTDTLLQVGGAAPSRLNWLNDGDVIRLTPNGPELIVNPPPVAEPQPNTLEANRLAGDVSPPVDRRVSNWQKPVAISAVVVIVIGVLWMLVPKSDPASPVATPQNLATPDEQVAPIGKPADKPVGAPVNVTDSVYAVLVASEDREQVYQVGTAWAVSPQRLVTSGAVVLAIERLRQTLDVVLVRHPSTKSDFFAAERIHPKYVELIANANQLQTQLVELDRQLERTVPRDNVLRHRHLGSS